MRASIHALSTACQLTSAKGVPAANWYIAAILPTVEVLAPIHAMQKRMLLSTLFLEATRQIRQLPGYATTPILAMTANAVAEDKALCLDAGMSDFLIKPVDPDTVFATLLRWLDR